MEKRLRLARLHELAAAVHRLPRSRDRDHLLRTLRSRAIDIDTGAANPSGWRDADAAVEGQRDADGAGLERRLNL